MKKVLLVSILFYSLSHSLWADTVTKLKSGTAYLGGSVGGTFPMLSHRDHFVNSEFGWPQDKYHDQRISSAPLFSILTGYTWASCHDWFPLLSFGGSYTYVSYAKVKGNLWQYGHPEFDNYTYQYEVQRQTFLAVLKAHVFHWNAWMPYFSIGTGFSINSTHNYAEHAKSNVIARISPRFKGASIKQVSYTVGTGVDYFLSRTFALGLEYNYGFFGNAKTGKPTSPNATHHPLHRSNLKRRLRSNTVTVGFNYLVEPII